MGQDGNISIKNWAIEDRPREKLLNKGIQSLSDAELIAILIGSGTKENSAVEVARKILNTADNNLNNLGKKSIKDLQKIHGIGEAKALSVIAALELGRRRKLADIPDKQKITSSNDVFSLFHPILADLPYEEFWILLLNRANKIIERYKISQGGVSGTVIDIKMILKNAVENLASSIILCHNHPSGNLMPSEADKSITKKLKEASELMDIKLLDHIIIGNNAYFSFIDEAIL
ncbi:MAG: DNA repair protein RadC [Bacteroidales bacterium]|nr:DNA repair protein RadC [Bacteroidales bacterium]